MITGASTQILLMSKLVNLTTGCFLPFSVTVYSKGQLLPMGGSSTLSGIIFSPVGVPSGRIQVEPFRKMRNR